MSDTPRTESDCYDFWDIADAPKLRDAGKKLRNKLTDTERENARLREDCLRMACSADSLIADLESRGLGWSLDHAGRLIEARVWDWPHVISRYRPHKTEPLAHMLAQAMYQVDWRKYPVKPNAPHH